MIESLRHVQVVGALARLAENGGWARITAGQALVGAMDVADARLLLASGVLRERGDGWEPVDLHPWYADPAVLASSLRAALYRAVGHALDRDADLSAEPGEIAAMGMASRSTAAILADSVLPMLPVTGDRLLDGSARFLDVGVGTGAIAETLCERFPGVSAVGLDVSDSVLAIARAQLADTPFAPRIELRCQSVAALADRDAYDLAWVPQVFLPRVDRGRRACRRRDVHPRRPGSGAR